MLYIEDGKVVAMRLNIGTTSEECLRKEAQQCDPGNPFGYFGKETEEILKTARQPRGAKIQQFSICLKIGMPVPSTGYQHLP